MIGQWGKAAALLVLGAAVVVDLGLAAALLDQAPRDLALAWARLTTLDGPGARLALAGREALLGGAVAGLAAAAAASLLGPAAASLPPPSRALLVALARVPALTALCLALLAAAALLDSGPIVAGLGGFAVATGKLGARWTLAAALVPLTLPIVEAAARRLHRGGTRTLATLGFGPARRFLAVAVPAIVPAALRAAAAAFLVAGCCLFVAAWPVPARHAAVAALSAEIPFAPFAALAFCVAVALAAVLALFGRRP